MSDLYTAAQLAEVHAYHQPKYVMAAAGQLLGLARLGVLCGLTPRLYRACGGRLRDGSASGSARTTEARPGLLAGLARLPEVLWGDGGWAVAVRFCLAFTLLDALLQLPEDVYFGYVLEHRFALSHETFRHFVWMNLKGLGALAFASALLGFGLFGLIRRTPRWWWVLGFSAGSLMLVASALDPYRGSLYFQHSELPAGPLRERLAAVLHQAQVPYARIVVEKTSVSTNKVNAYFAGQGPTRTIVLTDSLVENLSPDEVVAAVAHEAGHVHERRWLGRLCAGLAVVLFFALLRWIFGLAVARRWLGAESPGDIRLFPLMYVVFYLVTLLAAPVSGYFDREREREADRYAVRLTRDPASFQRMLVKVARIGRMDPSPPRWVIWMGARHPPVGERIDDVEVRSP